MLPVQHTESKTKVDKRERISPRLRHALDLMVWGDQNGKPLDYPDAGRAVNMSARSMRKALEKYHVRKYLMEQKQVLRACLTSKSLWRLDEIATQRSNMNAAVNAIKAIDGDEAAHAQSSAVAPGVVVRIVNITAPAAPDPTIDIAPYRAAPLPQPAEPDVEPIFKIP
jgi:hypothetical protein